MQETFTRSSLALNMSGKLLSDSKLAIHGKIMATNGHFSSNFDLFLIFFIDCGYIYVPKGAFWSSTSGPHIEDLVMSFFFILGSTVHDCGWPKNGPFWTKHGRLVNVLKWSKRDQNGQPKCFDHLGFFWANLNPFGQFQTKMIFLPIIDKVGYGGGAPGQKIQFLFRMV